ncbi:hypothetical protein DESUT3_15100 [Desulfuromonas versatilis]|uniref:Uncharacterized protein n=1 Tax=Desulfuromonas versatilis TaxID=2802975 RepID=A0ABM8HR97_9BACT|nr:hypothetical protein [Desulfuromonas versatilis]BCR04441.1 hypothetical protein DESUT3_15100 [Desulfuromonas versatilis]
MESAWENPPHFSTKPDPDEKGKFGVGRDSFRAVNKKPGLPFGSPGGCKKQDWSVGISRRA